MKELKFKKTDIITSGVITVVNWTLAKDGLRYLYFYCDRWEITTDKMMPVDGFKSVERWQLMAVGIDRDVLAIFPGCQIKAWMACDSMPGHKESDCYYLR